MCRTALGIARGDPERLPASARALPCRRPAGGARKTAGTGRCGRRDLRIARSSARADVDGTAQQPPFAPSPDSSGRGEGTNCSEIGGTSTGMEDMQVGADPRQNLAPGGGMALAISVRSTGYMAFADWSFRGLEYGPELQGTACRQLLLSKLLKQAGPTRMPVECILTCLIAKANYPASCHCAADARAS
eukprot:349641-Chlamydomonas_euryale.AAC.19